MNFEVVLERISDFLAERGFRHALIEGLGMAALGIPRTTLDLDLLVETRAQEDLIRFLEGQGYETLYRSTGHSNHEHPDRDWGRVDFVYVGEETGRRLFDEAKSVMGPHGRAVLVPRPGHLVAMKVVAMTNDPGRTFQELADIRSLLSLSGVDRVEVRAYSPDTDWSTAMKRSNEPSDLLDLEAGVPTTPEDIEALRRLRERVQNGLLVEANRLQAPACFRPPLTRRKTFEGCEPFEL